MLALRDPVAKAPAGERPRRGTGLAPRRPEETGVGAVTGAACGGKDRARRARRGGGGGRVRGGGTPAAGSGDCPNARRNVVPRIPKRRKGSDAPGVPESGRTQTAGIRTADVQGSAARSPHDLAGPRGMSGIGRRQVSRLSGAIDGKAKAFLSRPLGGDWRSPSDLNRAGMAPA
jgi:hypothetical protein